MVELRLESETYTVTDTGIVRTENPARVYHAGAHCGERPAEPMGRAVERLLVPAGSLRHLAICRIVAVAAQLLWFFPDLDEHVNLVRKNTEFIEPQMLIRASGVRPPREHLHSRGDHHALVGDHRGRACWR